MRRAGEAPGSAGRRDVECGRRGRRVVVIARRRRCRRTSADVQPPAERNRRSTQWARGATRCRRRRPARRVRYFSCAADIPVIHAVTDDLISRASRVHFARARGDARARAARRRASARPLSHRRADLRDRARARRRAGAAPECWLVVNERLDVALAARTRGAQLTSRSLAVADARLVRRRARRSARAFTAPSEAEAAEREGPTGCVAGHVFATPSHPGMPAARRRSCATSSRRTRSPASRSAACGRSTLERSVTPGRTGSRRSAASGDAPTAERAATDYLSHYDGAAAVSRDGVIPVVNGEERTVARRQHARRPASRARGSTRAPSSSSTTARSCATASACDAIVLATGDTVEIVHFVGGG